MQCIRIIIAAAVLLLVLASGAMAASEKDDKKIVGDGTKLLIPGAIPGYCPTIKDELTGDRPVIFINSLDVGPTGASVNLWALGGQGTVGSMDEVFPHGLRLTAYVGEEVVGVSDETQPWFSAGQFQMLVQFKNPDQSARILTAEEQARLKVVLKVDYYPECQRTGSGNIMASFYLKNDAIYQYGSLSPVTVCIDKKVVGKDYFYPSVLCYEIRDSEGALVAEPQYIVIWFDKGEYVLPQVELFEGTDIQEGELLYVTLRTVS